MLDQIGHQHTRGPWRVFDLFTDVEIVTERPTAYATESIVQFKGQRNSRANARLMAAAPELLAALIQAVTALNTAPRFRVPGLGDRMDSYKIAALCDRVIAKATGGAPARDQRAKADAGGRAAATLPFE